MAFREKPPAALYSRFGNGIKVQKEGLFANRAKGSGQPPQYRKSESRKLGKYLEFLKIIFMNKY